MYTPPLFRVEERDLLHAFLREYRFAALMGIKGSEAPSLSFLPLYLNDAGDKLEGHMARANPQWRDFADGASAWAVFLGPHGYISPSWYRGELHVPTWNYAAVEVRGKMRIIDSDEALEGILVRSVRADEAKMKNPWSYDLPAEFRAKLRKAIIGFELSIEEISGKFKLSQNREEEDFEGALAGVIAHYGNEGLAALMKR